MSDLPVLSAVQLLAAIRARRISCEEAVRALLARIDDLDGEVNAVVARRPEAAIAEARARDAALARGAADGPLHGLPMTIKDAIEVAGLPAVCGAPALRDHRPARDAVAVARLRAAGAVILGKTNVPLYAADFQTFNEVFGTTNNPYALGRTPGGSSGGSAAALAAGFTPVELGSDLAGSLRIPAHNCGIASLKPSYGIVPLAGSLSGPRANRRQGDLWVLGPMARRVADLRLLLQVIAGPASPDAVAWRLELPPAPTPGTRLRVAVWLDEPFCPAGAAVRTVLEGAARSLAAANVELVFDARPAFNAEAAFHVHCALMYGEMAEGLPGDVFDYFAARAAKGRPADLANVTDLQAAHLAARHREWQRANEARGELRAAWAEFFTGYDALLCPVAPNTAALHDHRRLDQRIEAIDGRDYPSLQHTFWASLASTACLPAATVPVGQDAAGMPIGMQVIGPFLRDLAVLEVAERLEGACGGGRPPRQVDGRFRSSAART